MSEELKDDSGGHRDPERTIGMLRQAVAASFADRYRKGCVVDLPAEGDVVVGGDLHGSRVNFIRLLKAADLGHHPNRHLILQEAVHGGPSSPQGGCLSYILFEGLAAVKAKHPDRVHLLVANHDLAEHMDQVIFKGGTHLNQAFHQGMAEAYGQRREEVRQWYERLIESLLVACRTQHGLFISHSTPEGRNLAAFDVGLFEHDRLSDDIHRGSSLYNLVWGRDYRPETADRFAELVGAELFLVSHTPCPQGYEVPNHRHLVIQSYDEAGCCVHLPLERPLNQAQLVASVRRLLTGKHPTATVKVALDEVRQVPGGGSEGEGEGPG